MWIHTASLVYLLVVCSFKKYVENFTSLTFFVAKHIREWTVKSYDGV